MRTALLPLVVSVGGVGAGEVSVPEEHLLPLSVSLNAATHFYLLSSKLLSMLELVLSLFRLA